MDNKIVTIIMTIREKYSTTLQSITSIINHTPSDMYNFIFIDCGIPSNIKSQIPESVKILESEVLNHQLNRYNAVFSNINSNVSNVNTKYTIFLDNDLIVEDNWLIHLITCAEETNAGIVGPIYLWNKDKIHMFGGTITIKNKDFFENHELVNVHRNILPTLKRKKCDYVEYHCLLIKTELLHIIDPNYKCVHQHIDLSMKAKQLGYDTYTEPLSVVSYLNDVKLEDYDKPIFKKRWNIKNTEYDISYFCTKWDFFNNKNFNNIRNFIKLQVRNEINE